MTEDVETPDPREGHIYLGHYERFLNLLPLPDLRTELEHLDEQRDEGTAPPFGLQREIRSNLAFRRILCRKIVVPLNSSAEDNAKKGQVLKEIQLLRFAAKLFDLQELELRIRLCTAKLEKFSDPDVSALQNLISELDSRAKNCSDGVC
ncbi:MAG: hypothetical protein ABJH07_11580 [Sedimentitalea sp.]|uniref:hypothetical protein n=1 Tax=Sedimentitalea sp. TaxID=2048915 RepID=UPI0032976B77